MELADITNNPRKRIRNEKEWQRNKAKVRRNSGEGKRPVVACHHQPHSFCKAANLSEEDIEDMFQACYRDSSKTRQDAFIASHIVLSPVMRRRGAEQSKRDRTYSPTFYMVTHEGNKLEVCSASFHSILALGAKRVRNIMKYSWENCCNPRPEKRGGARESARMTEIKGKIRAHIKTFQCCASHYGRNKTPHKRYLPSTLSIKCMNSIFNSENPQHQASYITYYRLFVTEFNLGFGNPKKDVCSYCTAQKAKIANESDDSKKRVLVTELLVHRCRARRFYQLMRSPVDDDTLVISFDLMQNQALPRSPVGEAYYARQLWLYVTGIIEHKPGSDEVPGTQERNDVHFYSWGEEEMGRGANQIASAVNDFLTKRLSSDSTIKKVKLYSDSCVGQNKNSTVLGMLNLVAYKYNVDIEHVFPVRGHSYMPPDRAFGRVEKRLRKIETILLPCEYLAEFSEIGRVYVHGRDWHASDYKGAIERSIRKPLPFKITEAKSLKIDPVSGRTTMCKAYSASGEQHSILKRGHKWSKICPQPLTLESCVKVAKQKDVKRLLQAVGIDINTDIQSHCGPLTYVDTIKTFYKSVCAEFLNDDMDCDSDEEEDEAIVAVYED